MAVEFEFMGNLVLIRAIGRPPLAFTSSQFDEALKRGEKYAQATPSDTRKTPVPFAENHQAPQEITHGMGNDPVCEIEAEPQAPSADRYASLAAVRRETFPNRKPVTPNAKEHIMAVWLEIELPASEIGETGYLRDIDYLQLPASHVRVVALEADGTWFGVREWSALEAPPPYQRARVQVSLEPGPTPLTAKNVVTLAKGAQAILDNFGTAGARR
jgi:hypothetical protein